MKVEVFHLDYCPYCHRTFKLFEDLGIDVKKYEIQDSANRKMYDKLPGNPTTVPQIIVNDKLLPGGWDGLVKRMKKSLVN